jgi:4-aminobutyrate aminotransferase-like enzyme/Ser/Thr protein kinase RdoA (MazF antagonist)
MLMSLLAHAPKFSIEDAQRFADEVYGLSASARPLPSERDQNFVLIDQAGQRFVLKIANATEQRSMLEAQNQVMQHLEKESDLCPKILRATDGREIATVRSARSARGAQHFIRLVTYLPGTPLGHIKRHSPELMIDLGRQLGALDAALQSFDHPALHRDFHWDFANGRSIVRQNLALITDREMRRLVTKLIDAFDQHTLPLLPELRQSIIYNDANDYNVIVGGGADVTSRNQRVTGLIDFGDMVFSYTLGDLAIAIAYAILDKPDPLSVASQILRGYHSTLPLNEKEIAALYGLIVLRLCMSMCIAAEQQHTQPDNAYLGISQQPIRNTLPKLARIHPRFAEAMFRQVCGLEAISISAEITRWLQQNADTFAPVLKDLHTTPLTLIDLSIGSPLLNGDVAQNVEPLLTPRVQQALDTAKATVGIGRYAEARYLYLSPIFSPGDRLTDEARTIHLGLDLFAEPGTPIYAPLAGKVHAFANNANPQDYGPIIILEHQAGAHTFYTLYGHLSLQSIEKLQIGQPIDRGEQLATLGSPEVNGGWTSHLHFQIIIDLLDLDCDFPGVALPSQRPVWQSFSPDPNLIIGLPHHLFSKQLSKAETLSTRKQRLGGNLSIAYKDPIKIERGWLQYLFDDEGRKYLDSYNNVAHVGHAHPRVVEAARQQLGVLNTNTRYLHDFINQYAERLTALLPDPLSVCFFVNSGSEANELALRLARAYTQQRDLIVLEAAYHGNTTSLIDISPYKHNGPGGSGTPDWVHITPIADDYRGEYKRTDPNAGAKYATHVKHIIDTLRDRGRGLSGFIAESLPSVGGQIIFPPDYLADVYRYVREAGGVCIADEVQTGFGRIGSNFWGFELQNVVPDIVVLGKPIGNGHPIGAVITRPEIAQAFNNGMEFFSTFGGNAVSCAIGLAVLDVVKDEGLQAHALRVGNTLLEKLRPFIDRYPIVGDVRGSGLFLGVELVRDRSTLEPAAEEAAFVVNRLREQHILLGTDGPYHNVIKIRPPMPFNEANADELVTSLDQILSESFSAE